MRVANGTNDFARARGCDRAADLVAYLYGEATPEEGAAFSRHLDSCAVCRDELAAFGGVRELVGAWRADALAAAPSLDVNELMTPAAGATSPARARERSALAALREFFTLSPLWLQAGTVAATLAVCVLAALTIARAEVRWDTHGIVFRTGAFERVVVKNTEAPAPNSYTKEQLDEIVSREIEVAREQWKSEQDRNRIVVTASNPQSSTTLRPATVAGQPNKLKNRKRGVPAQPQQDRQNLANAKEEDDDLPRLSDLLGGTY